MSPQTKAKMIAQAKLDQVHAVLTLGAREVEDLAASKGETVTDFLLGLLDELTDAVGVVVEAA